MVSFPTDNGESCVQAMLSPIDTWHLDGMMEILCIMNGIPVRTSTSRFQQTVPQSERRDYPW